MLTDSFGFYNSLDISTNKATRHPCLCQKGLKRLRQWECDVKSRHCGLYSELFLTILKISKLVNLGAKKKKMQKIHFPNQLSDWEKFRFKRRIKSRQLRKCIVCVFFFFNKNYWWKTMFFKLEKAKKKSSK